MDQEDVAQALRLFAAVKRAGMDPTQLSERLEARVADGSNPYAVVDLKEIFGGSLSVFTRSAMVTVGCFQMLSEADFYDYSGIGEKRIEQISHYLHHQCNGRHIRPPETSFVARAIEVYGGVGNVPLAVACNVRYQYAPSSLHDHPRWKTVGDLSGTSEDDFAQLFEELPEKDKGLFLGLLKWLKDGGVIV